MSHSASSYARQLAALLPPGRLWDLQTDADLTRLLQGVADELARIDARGDDLINEADPRTATETLADWERILGLPDERVTAIPGTTAGRRVAITQKYTAREGQNFAFFAWLCGACGYPLISIERFASQVFRVGDRVTDSNGVGGRLYGDAWCYAMKLYLGTPTAGALAQADFERVIRHVTHAHIQVVFSY